MKYGTDLRTETPFSDGDKIFTILLELYKNEQDGNVGAIIIRKPNLVSLYLNIADKSYKNAIKLHDEVLWPNLKYIPDLNIFRFEPLEKMNAFAYDLIEETISTIIFAYMAIEAFVNSLIPSNYKEQRNIKNETIIVDRDFVQKNNSLKDKIKLVVPKIYGFKLNTSEIQSWSKFVKLLGIRHEITHLKAEKLNKKSDGKYYSNQLNILTDLIYEVLKNSIHDSARDIIKYFIDKIDKIPMCPLEYLKNVPSIKDLIKFHGE